ncbi:late competence protein [Agrilactobacillus composti DSM 18527 = JCM 14202]|uniref:Late competence protein n=1 Tax=Agrilactobacillus composti DSM 18527 = JCM 14202 TaxID=1423734 RepID=A0A0R1XLL5_9LACO|nr:late competence protein [Agrilactobacillus composti DSM 18527 = JCM 14202]
METFQRIPKDNICPICQRLDTKGAVCTQCQAWQQLWPNETLENKAIFYYNHEMQAFFQQYKGNGDYRLADSFQAPLQAALKPQPKQLFTFIPSAPSHFEKRGFDPVVGLFSGVVPLVSLLTKAETPQPQAQKSREARLNTPQFLTFTGGRRQLKGIQEIILLDDIYTTGRTLMHGRTCLRNAGFSGDLKTFCLVRA